MPLFYCPYCSSRPKSLLSSEGESLICSICGEPLTKIPYIRFNQIVALVAATVFALQLVITMFLLFPKRNRSFPNKSLKSAFLLNVKKATVIE